MNIKFKNQEHEQSYKAILKRMGNDDEYHKSVAYLIALNKDTKKHMEDIFDFKKDCIKLEGLKKPWQTGTSKKTTRLAFNLWANVNSDEIEEEVNTNLYTVSEIFNSSEGEYFFQAVTIRYGFSYEK